MYYSIALAEVNNDDDDCNGVSNRSRNRSRSPPLHVIKVFHHFVLFETKYSSSGKPHG